MEEKIKLIIADIKREFGDNVNCLMVIDDNSQVATAVRDVEKMAESIFLAIHNNNEKLCNVISLAALNLLACRKESKYGAQLYDSINLLLMTDDDE